ncbi:unnamed protein product [Acanthoscelides obtectus]|uniref:Myb/SANT-like DNA-binding domain-containing protein n=1 Tax=Acanthoscelides obtectus TaxID=200917 RepID=A0A9P0JP14_ACAOB|nr:unnamed protein product [Acanthoscelides obtectus]CAK1639747.1 hypothetical protein AOBTE_LOCUS11353 [Acanthoscelides obtectus]
MGSEDLSILELNMNDFLPVPDKSSEGKTLECFFTRERTLKLLQLYKVNRKKLGSYEVKNMKKLWEIIAHDLSTEYKITIPANKCENKFKVLERNYKKVIENNNKTGRGRKLFEYEQDMDEIFEKKKNINPVILLSSSST